MDSCRVGLIVVFACEGGSESSVCSSPHLAVCWPVREGLGVCSIAAACVGRGVALRASGSFSELGSRRLAVVHKPVRLEIFRSLLYPALVQVLLCARSGKVVIGLWAVGLPGAELLACYASRLKVARCMGPVSCMHVAHAARGANVCLGLALIRIVFCRNVASSARQSSKFRILGPIMFSAEHARYSMTEMGASEGMLRWVRLLLRDTWASVHANGVESEAR
eukprot:359583-Chlamydomonas_euryale.AAC.1